MVSRHFKIFFTAFKYLFQFAEMCMLRTIFSHFIYLQLIFNMFNIILQFFISQCICTCSCIHVILCFDLHVLCCTQTLESSVRCFQSFQCILFLFYFLYEMIKEGIIYMQIDNTMYSVFYAVKWEKQALKSHTIYI